MYKLKGFILSVAICEYVRFEKWAWLGRQYAARLGLLNFKPPFLAFIQLVCLYL